jgi:hypothetical protein
MNTRIKPSIITIGLACATVGFSIDTGRADESIEIKLPKARYIGTPKPIKDPALSHLEKLQEKERLTKLTLKLPAGHKLLSQDKPVTASEEPIDGDLEMVTDGDMDAEQYCDVGINAQWLTVDLEADHELSAILIWHFHESSRAFHDVVVEVSSDKDFVKSTVVYNSDHDNSLGKNHGKGKDPAYVETNEGRVIKVKSGVKGRYVRFWSRGSSSDENNYYTEVQVYGK